MMVMPEAQPTPEQEAANAAYVWRLHIQEEMLGVLRERTVKIETAEWWFERYLNAYRAEIEFDRLAKDKLK
jgi:hypothetical protein